jgi:glycine cleavage system H protein
MSEVRSELKYTPTHEWVRIEDDGSAVVGISDHAQAALGDLVFVEIPAVGQTLAVGDGCAVVESVKAASDVYSPVAGEVIEANDALADSPELINEDPYGGGWLMKVRLDDDSGVSNLIDAATYESGLDE